MCRLFTADVDVEAGLYVSYTFKLAAASPSVQLGVGLTFDRPAAGASHLWLVGDDYSCMTSQTNVDLQFAKHQSVIGTWTTRCNLSCYQITPVISSLSPITVAR